MGSVPIFYEPLLSPAAKGGGFKVTATNDDDDCTSVVHTGGGRSIIAARSVTKKARRIRSCGNRLDNGGDDDDSSGELMIAAAGNNNKDRTIKRCHTAPGYVSLEDALAAEKEFSGRREGRRRSSRWMEDADGISDPLVRKASQLYAGSTTHYHQPPQHSGRSPGPMGTRRGSFVHRLLVKNLFGPCLGFLAVLCGGSGCSDDKLTKNYGQLAY